MNKYLQSLYESHHQAGKRAGFSIHQQRRGMFISRHIGKGKRILDLGCRDGTLSQYYLKGNDVTGVDIDEVLLSKAKKRGLKTKHVDLYDSWPFKTEFDAVVAGEVLEHLYHPEKIIAKVTKVLKPEGLFVVSVPNAYIISARIRFLFGREIPAHYDPTHINLFSAAKLERLLQKYFNNVKVTGFAPPAYQLFHPLSNSLFADDLIAIAQK